MIMKFDKFQMIDKPSIILCNPNGVELEPMDGVIYDTQFTLRYNTMSEMSFTVPIRTNLGEEVKWYNKIKSKRLIKVDDIGVFMITEVNKNGDGVIETKEVTAFSLEVDLNYKKINMLSGIYKFYNPLIPTDDTTLLGKVISSTQMRGWKIGYVSDTLWNKYRSYEVSDQTVYNFLMSTVEEAMECIFTFDTFKKTINVYSVEEAVHETDIYLSYDNLITNLNVEEMSDELVTALHCYGGGELNIRAVNPLGDVVIYNFDYFLNNEEEWLTDDLRNAIINWQNKLKEQQPIYANKLTEYRNKNVQLLELQGQLRDLQSQYNAIEGNLKVEIEANGDTSKYATELDSKKLEIEAKQVEVNVATNELESISNELNAINKLVTINNNFTEEQLKELSNYMVESTYTNDAFIKTSIMTPVEIQDMSQELYDLSNKILEKLSQPRYSFEMESVNFLFLKEFARFTQQLELGCQLNIDMDNGLVSYPVLLELTFSYEDPTNFSMTFGNRLRLDKNDYRFAELFGESINTGTSVTIQQGNWSEFTKNYETEVGRFMTSELDASKNAIINASNQEIKIGEHGMLCQKSLDGGGYSPKKAWWINNRLVFTKDNFQTISACFGETTNGAYGILGSVIVGKQICGENLVIESQNGSFRFDDNVYMKNANIVMTNDKGEDQTMQQMFGEVYTSMGKYDNVLTADGMLDTNKMQGQILGGKNNILCIDETNTKALVLNSVGMLISNTKDPFGNWIFTTAVSGDGVVADIIRANSTINAPNINGGNIIGSEIRVNGENGGVLQIGENTGLKVVKMIDNTYLYTMAAITSASDSGDYGVLDLRNVYNGVRYTTKYTASGVKSGGRVYTIEGDQIIIKGENIFLEGTVHTNQ